MASPAGDKVEIAKEILLHCDRQLSQEGLQKKINLFEKEQQRSDEDVQTDRDCLINDAIYGPVKLTPLMYKIINTSEFHRLKDIKQLGAAHYVYPGANHTRFDHSIGVYYLAGEFGHHLKQQLEADISSKSIKFKDPSNHFGNFDEKEVLCIQIAGLCHDLGHGPYSHMFEDNILQQFEDELKLKHDDLSVSLFRRMLVENPKVLVEFVREGLKRQHIKMIECMIQPHTLSLQSNRDLRQRAFLFEIVHNNTTGVDVNKWDYYARDCHYLGVTSDFQWRRCMHLGRIVMCEVDGRDELHIAFRDKQLDDIYGMYRTGVILHHRAHQHKTIKAVERMISDAFGEIHRSLELIHAHDREGKAKTIRETIEEAKKGNLEWYLALTDSIIGTIKCADLNSAKSNLDKDALKKAKDLLKRVEERDLYHMAGKLRIPKMYSVLDDATHLHEKNSVWSAAMDTERQPSNEAIYRLLPEKVKKEIRRDEIWVTIAKFKLPPAKFKIPLEPQDEGNPAEKVTFYKKREMGKPTELLTSDEVKTMSSLLVVPQAFVECELRVYDKRPAEKRTKEHQKALREALEKWKSETEDIARKCSPHKDQ